MQQLPEIDEPTITEHQTMVEVKKADELCSDGELEEDMAGLDG